MKRWDFDGGIFLRIGRWWYGLFAAFPFLCRVPCIAGGSSQAMLAEDSYLMLEMGGSPGSPTSMQEISEVISIGSPGGGAEERDVTHLRSPNRRREFKQGFIDDGTLPFTVQYIPADPTHQRLLELYNSGEIVTLREVFPDATGWDYTGFVKTANKSGQDVGGKIVIAFGFRLTGAIEFNGTGSPA